MILDRKKKRLLWRVRIVIQFWLRGLFLIVFHIITWLLGEASSHCNKIFSTLHYLTTLNTLKIMRQCWFPLPRQLISKIHPPPPPPSAYNSSPSPHPSSQSPAQPPLPPPKSPPQRGKSRSVSGYLAFSLHRNHRGGAAVAGSGRRGAVEKILLSTVASIDLSGGDPASLLLSPPLHPSHRTLS